MKATFTYQITTESYEIMDTAEHGWIMPGKWHYPLMDSRGLNGQTLDDAITGAFDITDLREIISFAQDLGIDYDSGNWFSSGFITEDYSTDEKSYELHFEGVSPASRRRIARLLGIDVNS